jgi:hypothetical protein
MLATGAAVVAACASGGGAKRSESCGLRTSDSTFLARGPVYRDCAVDRRATATSTRNPDFRPPSYRTTCYYANVEFVVDPTGHVEEGTPRVVSTNETSLGQALLDVVPSWRYEPAQLNGVPVRQIVTEHRAIGVGTVVVPKGSGPPSGLPAANQPLPC